MDDLNQKLDRLLSSPDGLKKIEDLMSAFGAAPSQTAQTPQAPSASAPPPASPMPDMGMMLKLMPLLSQLGKEDDTAALFRALRPHLQHERQKKLDEAGQMLKLMKLLPLLSELKKGEEDA